MSKEQEARRQLEAQHLLPPMAGPFFKAGTRPASQVVEEVADTSEEGRAMAVRVEVEAAVTRRGAVLLTPQVRCPETDKSLYITTSQPRFRQSRRRASLRCNHQVNQPAVQRFNPHFSPLDSPRASQVGGPQVSRLQIQVFSLPGSLRDSRLHSPVLNPQGDQPFSHNRHRARSRLGDHLHNQQDNPPIDQAANLQVSPPVNLVCSLPLSPAANLQVSLRRDRADSRHRSLPPNRATSLQFSRIHNRVHSLSLNQVPSPLYNPMRSQPSSLLLYPPVSPQKGPSHSPHRGRAVSRRNFPARNPVAGPATDPVPSQVTDHQCIPQSVRAVSQPAGRVLSPA